MNTLLQQAEKAVDTDLTRARWALGLNGALALAFGI